MVYNDSISRSALLAQYDAEHAGPPGKARGLITNAKGEMSAVQYINARRKMCREYYGDCSEGCPECPLYDNCEGLEMDAEDVVAIVQKWVAEQAGE